MQAPAVQGVAVPTAATVDASNEQDTRVAAPIIGGLVAAGAVGAALFRHMPTTSFGPIQKLWVPAVAGALALGAGTGAAAGIGAIQHHAGASSDTVDLVAGAAGLTAWVALGHGAPSTRSNPAAFARLLGGVVGAAAIGDAAIRHGSDALESAGVGELGSDAIVVGTLAAAGTAAGYLANRHVQLAASSFTGERAFGYALGTQLAERVPVTPLPTVSLGAASVVPQETIGKLGRQFLEGAIPATEISAATGRPAVDPVRVFVDLHSAPDSAGRLDLLRREIQRLGVIGGDNHRSTIVMVSPAGGVTDLVATDARELLEGGDVAHLAVAFSDRPALQSFQRVPEGIRQFREAVAIAREEIDRLPEAQRPRLEVYGESIGGLVGEQAMLKDGIAGLDARGVDRAIYVGSPSAGRAKRALLAAEGTGDSPRVIRYASLDDARARYGDHAVAGARVQFLEHTEDAITSLRPRRIWQPTPIPPGSVVHNQYAHAPFATFAQTLGDAVNFRQPPGRLGARGHNYGADLPGVLRQLHPELGDEQVQGVVDVVRRKAADRARLVDVPDLPEGFRYGSASESPIPAGGTA